MSAEFCRQISPLVKPYALSAPAREVTQWCLDWHARYNSAPMQQVTELFASARESLPDADAAAIETMLSSLSDEYEHAPRLNIEFMLDSAEKFLRTRAIEELRAKLARELTTGKIEQAEAALAEFKRLVRPRTVGVDPFDDKLAIVKAFDRENSGERLYKLPGDVGEAIGYLERGFLVGILAQQKRGKTWWLQEFGVRAALAGYNVLFLSLEMTQDQMLRRISSAVSGKPLHDGDFLLPTMDCSLNQVGGCALSPNRVALCKPSVDGKKVKLPEYQAAPRSYRPCCLCRNEPSGDFVPAGWWKTKRMSGLDGEAAAKKLARVRRQYFSGNRFQLVSLPGQTSSVKELRALIENKIQYEGFIPDVIITDYADRISPDTKTQDFRHGLSAVWDAHKAIALERHCLVVTASQANTARTGGDANEGSWAESISKLSVIDIGFALNQKEEEKRAGIMRVPIVAQRHERYDSGAPVTVLYSYDIGRPALDSWWKGAWKK